MKTKYTVIGFADGDYHVEPFVEHVTCEHMGDAWDIVARRVKRRGDDPYGNATEIVTYAGHLESIWEVRK